MSTNTKKDINKLYEYTLQQMAAESYFEGVVPSETAQIKQRLRLGTNRLGFPLGNLDLNEGFPGYTRMTEKQADEFLTKFKVVHQWSDNPTTTGSRPTQSGDIGYLALDGQQILANTGLSATLIQNKDTGEYTLAIRSTEFRDWAKGGDGERDAFSGADGSSGIFGSGFALAQQEALESYYTWLKQTPNMLPATAKLNLTGYSLGGNLATVFTEMHRSEMNGGETITFNGAGRGTWDYTQGSLADMVSYFRQVLNNPSTPPPRPLTVNEQRDRTFAINIAGQPFDPKSIYGDFRYQWAIQATTAKFLLRPQAGSNEGRVATLADDLITQVFGYETTKNYNATANSGTHGPALRVGIESQPGVESLSGIRGLPGDFGNGHAIVLIADSLAIQRAMSTLDATFLPDRFISMLPGATHRKIKNGTYANYETDALENILDGLRRVFLGADITKTEFKDGASGFGDITKRESFYTNLNALTENTTFKALKGKLQINASLPTSSATAKTDFGAFLSLVNLTPFTIKGDEVAMTALKSANQALATKWDADKALSAEDRKNGKAHFSDKYLEDRAKMLAWVDVGNVKNTGYGVLNSGWNWQFRDVASGKAGYALVNTSAIAGADAAQGNEAALAAAFEAEASAGRGHKVLFGGNDVDTFSGTSLEDSLYGGNGGDVIDGKAGNDYLEGNAGIDNLRGGIGNDTLIGGTDNDRLEGGAGVDTYTTKGVSIALNFTDQSCHVAHV